MGKGLLHIRRKRSVKLQRLPRHRMDKCQPCGMQGLSGHAVLKHAAIDQIGHQRMANRGHVHPDLVGAPGMQRT